ncbi:thioesterase [Paramagnetospirillum marisnigri]|uniref:Thioesterase n=1 Tax=Paramagnetospirillum marisnigri TaxID=1285242 RepID=A0A178M8D8_9PROT|nr:thioesterase family protein [Paramagnetospirillum marisnigri]OAN44796.1 thioesterase [Paramagnetospirillum marisnigri]
MSHKKEIGRQSDYPYRVDIQTRWSDNDMFGHLNNVVYQRFFEFIVVDFLRGPCGIDLMNAPVITFAAESTCKFLRPLSYPTGVVAGIRIDQMGRTSARYGLALFEQGCDEAAAEGHWIHVFVERDSGRPTPIPDDIRAVFERFRRIP